MKALITGGAGFVGSHLADVLLKDGHEVTIIDNLVRTNSLVNIQHLLKDIKFIGADLQFLTLKDIGSFDIAYHLATTTINRSTNLNTEGHHHGANAGFHLIEMCKQINAKLIYVSSASVYQTPQYQPIDEDHPCIPTTLYGAAKYYLEGVTRTFHRSDSLKYGILRPFNIYGPRLDSQGAYTTVITTWIKNALLNKPLVVYGNPDEKSLDLIHVYDVVSALQLLTQQDTNDVFNICSGIKITLREFSDILNNIIGNVKLEVKPENRTDIEKVRIGDNTKIKSIGWEQKVSLLNGLTELIEIHRRNLCQ